MGIKRAPQANSYGWQLNWVGRPKSARNASYCSGQTPAGATNWQAYGSSGIYLDVGATGCNLTGTPRYITSMGGYGNHFAVTGATAIYAATATGFRVYVRYANGAPISPAQANQYGWQLNWTALPAAMNRVETKYYHFAGQRIAMKRDGILTYLHSDHLGSAVLETNASGQIVADQRYYAYGKQRDSGPVGTDHRFTGQKQDASGLVYMNARYYDSVLGQFISPDTLVPDAGLLVDYNRYGYARGNPLKFSDPSGHCPRPDGESADANIICVAGFIPTSTSTGIPGLVYFEGDSRDFMSDSPGDASRFWLWINTDTGEIEKWFVHATQRVSDPNGTPVGEPTLPRNSPDPNPIFDMLFGSNHFATQKGEDGSITLKYSVVCSDPICNNALAPNGAITFKPNGYGSFDSFGVINIFPNLEAYHWNGGDLQNKALFRMQNFSEAERASGHGNWTTSFGMALSVPFSSVFDNRETAQLSYYLAVDQQVVIVR